MLQWADAASQAGASEAPPAPSMAPPGDDGPAVNLLDTDVRDGCGCQCECLVTAVFSLSRASCRASCQLWERASDQTQAVHRYVMGFKYGL